MAKAMAPEVRVNLCVRARSLMPGYPPEMGSRTHYSRPLAADVFRQRPRAGRLSSWSCYKFITGQVSGLMAAELCEARCTEPRSLLPTWLKKIFLRMPCKDSMQVTLFSLLLA